MNNCGCCDPLVIDVCHFNGNTFHAREFVLKNKDLTPLDLTGAMVYISLKPYGSNGRAVFEFSTDPGSDALLDLSEGAAGKIIMPDIDAWTLKPFTYISDVYVVLPNDYSFTAFIIKWDISNNMKN